MTLVAPSIVNDVSSCVTRIKHAILPGRRNFWWRVAPRNASDKSCKTLSYAAILCSIARCSTLWYSGAGVVRGVCSTE